MTALQQHDGLSKAQARVADVVAGVPTQLVIGGRNRAASDGATFEVLASEDAAPPRSHARGSIHRP